MGRIKVIVKCPSHPPRHLSCLVKTGPLSLHGFYCHNPYSFSSLWNAPGKMQMVVSVGRLFSVAMHRAFTVYLTHVSSTLVQRGRYHCSEEGEYPCGSALRNVPCFISSQGRGEGGDVGRPLFLVPFVYVRSGIGVLGEQKSLGMLGLHSLGITCSCVVLCIS